nr:hypothetical protein [Allomuricauda sp.]
MNCFRSMVLFLLGTVFMNGQEFVQFEGAELREMSDHQLMEVTLFFKVMEGHYIQSERPKSEYLIPTEIQIAEHASFRLISTEFSKARSNHRLDGVFRVILRARVDEASNLKREVKGTLAYQACSDKQCFFPRTLDFQIQNL